MLAYQAASVELAMLRIRGSTKPDPFNAILLGTAHVPRVNAFSYTETASDFSVTVLFSGLVDFIYQAAKAVADAAAPKVSQDPSVTVEADFSEDYVEDRLNEDSSPSDRLYRTLESYFFFGYPRAFSHEYVPEPYHPFLSLLVSLAERWIIGHEYGHSVFALFGKPTTTISSLQHEVLADAQATVLTVLSAAELDLVPPEKPIGSAMFALKCLEIVERAYGIVTTGRAPDMQSTPLGASHPCPRDRADNAVAALRQFFDLQYVNDHRNFELAFVLRSQLPSTHGFGEIERLSARAYADTLERIWHRSRVRLSKDFESGRPLHSLWQSLDN